MVPVTISTSLSRGDSDVVARMTLELPSVPAIGDKILSVSATMKVTEVTHCLYAQTVNVEAEIIEECWSERLGDGSDETFVESATKHLVADGFSVAVHDRSISVDEVTGEIGG